MPTIFQEKEQSATETPILLFDCVLSNGEIERWSTHKVVVSGATYQPRVLLHNLFQMQTSSDMGVDAIPKISVTLANADSHFSELERLVGWKGASVTVTFLFFKLKDGIPETETMVLFKGIANPPDEIREATFRLTAVNRMSMQRVMLPPVRVERRCPWEFPANLDQRTEAVTGGPEGIYSHFFRCGYSPDVPLGVGNLNGSVPFTSCSFTRPDCEARGMFRQDTLVNITRRFGGIEFVPASISVRSYGEKGSHLSPLEDNEARYNDFVPLVYGTVWHSPLIVFSRNDGNLTRIEVLLSMGEIQGVTAVLVNNIEIPLGQAGANMTGTGWFSVVSNGNRTGTFNADFSDGSGNPLGDPYGSMAYLSVVVPNRINNGQSLPTVKVLMQGMKLPVYGLDGSESGLQFTNNAAWVLMDVLRRSGWSIAELDVPSFAAAAGYCDEQIDTQDLYGNATTIPRFQCNLILKTRRTAADAIRGIRNGSRLYLTYGPGGLLQVRVENTLALQQPVQIASSNSTVVLNGGWPAYEFGDGASGTTGLLRKTTGEPSLRLYSRSMADTPNSFSVEFQDSFNEYQQDSLSLIDVADVAQTGQQITGPFSVLGIPNYDQAARALKFNLDRSIQGNTYVEFETSVRAIGIQPGDLISLTYLKEGFNRQPFRVIGIAPGTNYRTAVITAQIHNDTWYSDTNGQTPANGRRQPGSGLGLPRPLIGTVVDVNGELQFGIVETSSGNTDGGATEEANVSFFTPPAPAINQVGIPLLDFAPTFGSGGTLAASQTLYYAFSAVDAAGDESALSFVVPASIPAGGNTNTVTVSELSFSSATTGFNVYRGPNPSELFRIASNQTVSAQFIDTGLPEQLASPPDPNYDHANFYWRLELQPEYSATLHSTTTVGNGTLTMVVNAYRGAVVRITRGRGVGQERAVQSNTATTLTLTSPWDMQPDATSFFTVAESGWHFGATGSTSPVQFEIPNRAEAIVQITGRAANANDEESPAELATVTRWLIGGAGIGGPDGDVPPLPAFGIGLIPNRGGYLEVGGIGFISLVNTQTIDAATFTIHYFDELAGQPQTKLSAAIQPGDQSLDLTVAGSSVAGSFIQVELEVMQIIGVLNSGTQYEVTRAMHGTTAVAHASQTLVYPLQAKVAIASFAREFFGSVGGAGWTLPVLLPDARVATAELFLTNSRGDSPTAVLSVTQTVDSGLRTLSGGQYSIEVDGFLAIENGVAPDLLMDATHSVRDIYAVVSQAPSDSPIQLRINQTLPNQSPVLYCTLTIPVAAVISSSQNGFPLIPLATGARVSLDITGVGGTNPGSDLTVIIRL
jgi:Putative phage tail protein